MTKNGIINTRGASYIQNLRVVLLAKDKLSTIKVLTSKSLIDSYISHDEFVSVKNDQENIMR